MKRLLYILISLTLITALPACNSSGTSSHEEGEEHEHEHGHLEGADEVELTQAQMDAVGIRLGKLEARSMSEVIQATGVLAVNAQSEGLLTPKYGGRVVKLLIAEGQPVKAGETVAWIEVPELLGIRQQIAEARQEVAAARTELNRQEALASQGAGVRKNLENARAQVQMAELKVKGFENQLAAYGASGSGNTIPVKAEVSGVVTKVDVPVGGYADAQLPVARVVNNDAVFCTLQVLEKDINSVKTGMEVDLQLTNDAGRAFVGKVVDVMPVLDPESHTIPVKVSIVGDKGGVRLIPGMAVSGRISTGGSTEMALPEAAIVSSGGKSYIFVLEGEHEEEGGKAYHFEKVEVVAGATSLGYTAITPLKELEADARIVVAGAFYLNSMVSDHGEHNH